MCSAFCSYRFGYVMSSSRDTKLLHAGKLLLNILCCQENVGLKVLRLEFNGFGNDGGSAMGQALAGNRTLKELDLSNNRIPDTAVRDIAAGLATNDGLEILKVKITA